MYICIYIYICLNITVATILQCAVTSWPAPARMTSSPAGLMSGKDLFLCLFIVIMFIFFYFPFFYFFLFLLNVREKHMYVCSYKNNMYVKMRVCSYICMQLFKCMYVNIYIYIYVYMYVCPGKTYACINTTCRMSMKNHQLDISR